MSWLYVPGSARSNWEFSLRPPPPMPSVSLNTERTPQVVWSELWIAGSFVRHLSGATLKPSTAARGVESWISSLRATLASRFPSPASASELKIPDTSGPTSRELCTRRNRLSVSSRTLRVISATACPRCAATFTPWATELKRVYSRRRKSARRTGESGYSSLLPTPTASTYGSSQNGSRPDGSTFKQAGKPSLETMAKRGLLPTPTASEATSGGETHWGTPKLRTMAKRNLFPTPTSSDHKRSLKDAEVDAKARQGGSSLSAAIGSMLATPTASDARSSGMRTGDKAGKTLTDQLIRDTGADDLHLNPRFVEWMMGWPHGLSNSEPSATE